MNETGEDSGIIRIRHEVEAYLGHELVKKCDITPVSHRDLFQPKGNEDVR